MQVSKQTLTIIIVLLLAAWIVHSLTPILWNLIFGAAALFIAATLNGIRLRESKRYRANNTLLWLNAVTLLTFIIGIGQFISLLRRIF